MIEYPALQPYSERYADMEMRPLTIRLYLEAGSQLAGYDPLHLDNLLARCVVDEATQWQGLPAEHNIGYALPVPLQCLWRDSRGYPLWAATPFVPAEGAEGDVWYRHKRQQSGRWTGTKRGTLRLSATSGRWMERRVPVPTVVAPYWEARCIGNAIEIGRLLDHLSQVGKERSRGMGVVERWEIEPTDTFRLVGEDNELTRSLPMGAVELLNGWMPTGAPAPVGWTPPQWLPGLFAPGWWSGTPVEGDWFHGLDR